MDPSLQDNVLIPDNFFEYIYHVGCYFNMHSIIELGSIAGGKKCQLGSTNGILHSRESFGHALSRAERIRSDKASICCSQAKVESTPRCSVLDRNRARSKKGTKVFPNEVKRNKSPRHSHQSVLKEWCPQRHKKSNTQEVRSRHVLCPRLFSKIIGKWVGILMQHQAAAAHNQSNQNQMINQQVRERISGLLHALHEGAQLTNSTTILWTQLREYGKTATCPNFNSNHQLPSSDDVVVTIQSPKILIEHTHTNVSFHDDYWLAQLGRCRHTAEAVMERKLQKASGAWLGQLEFGLEFTERAHQFNL